MASSGKLWKKGRGKLGMFAPVLGTWRAEGESQMGPFTCTRTLTSVLNGTRVQLNVLWEFRDSSYEEIALFGPNDEKEIAFWSFTSDGKSSGGVLAETTDVHPEAFGFVADMPAGTARQIYWPDDEGGFRWAVESRTKKGWNRFTEHHYRQIDDQ